MYERPVRPAPRSWSAPGDGYWEHASHPIRVQQEQTMSVDPCGV